ncbi:MAG: alpha/beta hydrolase [candidate division Zixibacteria bacterium]
MKNYRLYGKPPFEVAVIHGGPGAPGEMAPVARELASTRGVMEPFQTATSIQDQIDELKTVLENKGDLPVTLIGFSWGAWLSYIFAAHNPIIVKKLILVGSGPFEQKYAEGLMDTRLNRLGKEDKIRVKSILKILNNPESENKNESFTLLGELLSRADTYNPIDDYFNESEIIECQSEIFQRVWNEAVELRSSGTLLEIGKHIKCPIVAIHGDYDPHPAEGVEKLLSPIINNFRFILLKNCGHKPWIEQEAKSKFFDILYEELS